MMIWPDSAGGMKLTEPIHVEAHFAQTRPSCVQACDLIPLLWASLNRKCSDTQSS